MIFDPLNATKKAEHDKKYSIKMNSKKNKKFFARQLRFVRDNRAVTFPVTNGTMDTYITGEISRCEANEPTIYFSWPENFGTAPDVGAPVEVVPVGRPRFV